MTDATTSAYTDRDMTRFGRRDGTATRSPALAVERLRRALAQDWAGTGVSPTQRDLYEQEFAKAFVTSVMALDIAIGDEVMPDELGQVVPAPTNIDAHYVLVGVDGDTALIRRASFPKWAPARTPLSNLRRVSRGTCSVHGGTFPGVPGSRWRDADGDMWIVGDDRRLHAVGCSLDPNKDAAIYGPMTPAGGES